MKSNIKVPLYEQNCMVMNVQLGDEKAYHAAVAETIQTLKARDHRDMVLLMASAPETVPAWFKASLPPRPEPPPIPLQTPFTPQEYVAFEKFEKDIKDWEAYIQIEAFFQWRGFYASNAMKLLQRWENQK